MTDSNFKKIFICATEQSGDNIGASIINELLKSNSNLVFDGIGGNKMSNYLNNQYFSIEDFKSIGIIEIIFSLKKYLKMITFLSNKIINKNYDLVITIDSPDFNYPLVSKLRKFNFDNNVVQIVAPTVWAWRKYRAKKFAKIFNEILVLFNFETQYFNRYNLKTTFMGHPIFYIDIINNKFNKDNIAFLFGSRLGEINSLFKYFNSAYEYLLKNHPDIKIFIPTLPHLKANIENLVKNWKIKTVISTSYKEIENNFLYTKYALVCSGTASLEIAKRNIPQLIIYKLNFFTELILKNLTTIKYANIINIIENKMIIPELTNSNLNENYFIKEFFKLINDHKSNTEQILNINNSLPKIESYVPPYKIAADRILNYL